MAELNLNSRIFCGGGALERLGQVQNKNVLIVTDKFMVQSGAIENAAAYLTQCQVTVFDGVVPDPPIAVIAEGVRAFGACEAETVVAIGGGSVIDAAKAIKMVAAQASNQKAGQCELIAIPTTSGTGSEVTDIAVIADSDREIKYPLVSEELRPAVAILDPNLTISVPPAVTADTGMDVLTHALEAYVSTNANDFSDALCEKAISFVFRFLPLAYQDGNNLLAREKMHIASCMAGLAFNAAGLGLTHGMAHAIGGKLHIAHGRINAMLLPYVLRFNAALDTARNGEYTPAAQKYQQIAQSLCLPASGVRMGVNNLIREVERLNRIFGIPATLKEMKIDLHEMEGMRTGLVSAALSDTTTKTNPRLATPEQVDTILSQLIGKRFIRA